MSYTIAHYPALLDQDNKKEVFAFRKKIYHDELKLDLNYKGDILSDSYDIKADNFLLKCNESAIGTIRLTVDSIDNLEIFKQHIEWYNWGRAFFSNHPYKISEFNRLMISRDSRGNVSLPVLVYYAIKQAINQNVDFIFLLVKQEKNRGYIEGFMLILQVFSLLTISLMTATLGIII